ncbi:MAG: chitobiase/beta-hexosaminidase C-terminal domain-containing protein [candidate division Zixibacteria bacterium]|nr:chitobiase/beta-hexosaminidase C-terminal domain-containing protein [candidate division Zixibacteria bacterium]
MRIIVKILVICLILGCMTSLAQSPENVAGSERQLLMVGTAHLDTQWRWTIQNTINEYIPSTFRDNFKLLDQFPGYVFSFEGAFRYMLIKEYYPDDYELLKGYINSNRWRVIGSWVDAVDVNIPSFESLVRQTLYGNGYFKREFGKTSRDIFLPDCFGFGYALPSIARHCGLQSFSTQKLSWGSSVGVPFDIGVWTGVDGSSIFGGLKPGAYVNRIEDDLSRDTLWLAQIDSQGTASGLYAGYGYFGTGDTGGAPDSASVDWLQRSEASDGPIRVWCGGADDLVDMALEADTNLLPHYRGELLMTRHGVGCYTSQAAMKRWNRKNELLADAAERASVIASHLRGFSYPGETLRDSWVRFLWHQFHDDLTGTSIPEAYEFSWSDEILAMNRFASVLENAVEATVSALDTRAEGVPVVLFNPLSIERTDVVEASVKFNESTPEYVRVIGPDGREVPSQLLSTNGNEVMLLFAATVPSVGYSVYDIRSANKPSSMSNSLKVSTTGLENERYKVAIDADGNVASIFDKMQQQELLSAPIQYQLLFDKPRQWPAWEIQYEDIMQPPLAVLGNPESIEVIEEGPVRAAVKVIRKIGDSEFATIIRLCGGLSGDRIEFFNDVNWYEKERLLKVAFPVTAANDSVTYDLGLGTIRRGLNREKLYEVPGHQWADITEASGEYGVAVLNDCKYGWDHPDRGTLRLTLIHTPGVFESWMWVGDQKSQDLGHHQFSFAVSGHPDDWRQTVPWQAARFNQPIVAFQTDSRQGPLGKSYSFLKLVEQSDGGDSDELPGAFVNSVKQAEESDEIIVRVKELQGLFHSRLKLRFADAVVSAREVDGCEDSLDVAKVGNGELTFDLKPYQPKAFAIRLRQDENGATAHPESWRVDLPFNEDGISSDRNRLDGDFDGQGNTLSGDLLPDHCTFQNIEFNPGSTDDGHNNMVACKGQTIQLPQEPFNRLYILAASTNGPSSETFTVDNRTFEVDIPDYAEPMGQWNNRVNGRLLMEEAHEIAPAFISHVPVAWYGCHRHTTDGDNEAYRFTYLHAYRMGFPNGARTLILPDNPRVKVLAITAAQSSYANVRPVEPLYDIESGTFARISAERTAFLDPVPVTLSTPIPGAAVHYTLDGTDPTETSPIYVEPITIAATSTVKARAIRQGFDDRYVTAMSFQKLSPHPSHVITDVAPGLNARYFEGSWSKVPEFDTIAALREFVADQVLLPPFARDEDFGMTFTGQINVPADGLYEFEISSDDGSLLWISDSLVVDNDGLHGGGFVGGAIALKAGYHPIRVYMFQAKGDRDLQMRLTCPQMQGQSVPADWLFH